MAVAVGAVVVTDVSVAVADGSPATGAWQAAIATHTSIITSQMAIGSRLLGFMNHLNPTTTLFVTTILTY